jgi:CO/xanthine dehydrogenase Mo-binding subunit
MGLAQYLDGKLTIWTHNQGVYPMRALAARITGLSAEAIEVIHGQGPGCYGHNGADDPPIDAALIAIRRPGRPIRVQWRREDEFGFAPVGTAMVMELAAELDASGRLVDYTAEIWNTPHTGARGTAVAESALAGYVPPPPPPQRLMPDGSRFSGGLLNATPSYDIEATRTLEHVVETPIRSRPCAAWAEAPNTFAAESFIDELAEAARPGTPGLSPGHARRSARPHRTHAARRDVRLDTALGGGNRARPRSGLRPPPRPRRDGRLRR